MDRLSKLLLPWFSENHRELPWRRDNEPYHIWLSEVMLQQTRVEAVKQYYERFLQKLPTIEALANAEEDELLKLWEGLGYYSRVRNLQKAARQVQENFGGVFPREYDKIRSLSGIGAYTAGAICSICFNQPTPAVDGNVLRVITRYLACDHPINEDKTKKETQELLRPVYPEEYCGDFTQALMELGATVCVPNGAPLCEQCPLKEHCKARQAGMQQCYPVKTAKKARRQEERTVFILYREDRIALCKRPQKGLLAGLWQLPDVSGTLSWQQALKQADLWGVQPTDIQKTVSRIHIFTHVQWNLTGIYLRCACEGDFFWASAEDLKETIGLPTAYRQFLEE